MENGGGGAPTNTDHSATSQNSQPLGDNGDARGASRQSMANAPEHAPADVDLNVMHDKLSSLAGQVDELVKAFTEHSKRIAEQRDEQAVQRQRITEAVRQPVAAAELQAEQQQRRQDQPRDPAQGVSRRGGLQGPTAIVAQRGCHVNDVMPPPPVL